MGGPEQAHSDPDANREDQSFASTAAETEAPGVFGSLPRHRPAFRSPRRERRDAAPRASRAADGGRPEPEPPATERARPGREAEVEAVARAGAALAAEAATLGLRLAGRAAAALRETVERR